MKLARLPLALKIMLLLLSSVIVVWGLAWLRIYRYESHDEALEPQTIAWLTYAQRPALDPHQNAYMLLTALSSQANDPMAAAQELLDAEHDMIDSASSAGRILQDADFNAAEQRILRYEPPQWISMPCGVACYDDTLARRRDYEKEMVTEATLLARYDTLLTLPRYQEYRLPGFDYPGIHYNPMFQADRDYLRRMVYRLEDGHAEVAYADWSRRQQFFVRAAMGSTSFLHLLIMRRQLEIGQYYLLAMLASHPETLPQARTACLPLLDEKLAQAIRDKFGKVIASDLPSLQNSLTTIRPVLSAHDFFFPIPKSADSRIMSILLAPPQPHAALNFARRLIEDSLSRLPAGVDGLPVKSHPDDTFLCSLAGKVKLVMGENMVGKTLACIAFGNSRKESFYQRLDILVKVSTETRQTLVEGHGPTAYTAARKDIEAALAPAK